MGFRNPLRTATGVDTGGAGQRVVISTTGGLEGGGAVLVYPNTTGAPGSLEAGTDDNGPLTILRSPPDPQGISAELILRGRGPYGTEGVHLSTPGDVTVDSANVVFTGKVTQPRVYAALFTATPDTYVANWQDVYWRAEGAQQGGGFTAPGYRFIVPVAGDYEISGQMTFASLPASTYYGARIFASGIVPGSAALFRSSTVVSDCTAPTPVVTVTCARGASIGLQAYSGVGYTSRGTGASDGISPSLTIRKI